MRYVGVDFETANSSPLSACSVGICVFEDGMLIKSEEFLIKPPKQFGTFNRFNTYIHGITSDMVLNAPHFDQVWTKICDYIHGNVVVCHNAMFDVGVLKKLFEFYEIDNNGFDYICTVKVSKKVWPDMENHKLNTVSKNLNIKLCHHNAGSDCLATAKILINAIHQMKCKDVYELADKIGIQVGSVSKDGEVKCAVRKKVTRKRSGI